MGVWSNIPSEAPGQGLRKPTKAELLFDKNRHSRVFFASPIRVLHHSLVKVVQSHVQHQLKQPAVVKDKLIDK